MSIIFNYLITSLTLSVWNFFDFFDNFNLAWNLKCSSTVSAPIKTSFCWIYAEMWLISSPSETPLTSTFPSIVRPFIFLLVSVFIKVLFPAPELPMIAISVPGFAQPETECKIVFGWSFSEPVTVRSFQSSCTPLNLI